MADSVLDPLLGELAVVEVAPVGDPFNCLFDSFVGKAAPVQSIAHFLFGARTVSNELYGGIDGTRALIELGEHFGFVLIQLATRLEVVPQRFLGRQAERELVVDEDRYAVRIALLPVDAGDRPRSRCAALGNGATTALFGC